MGQAQRAPVRCSRFATLRQLQQRLEHNDAGSVVATLREGELAYFRQCDGPAMRPPRPFVLCWSKPWPDRLMVAVLAYFAEPQRLAETRPRIYDALTCYFDQHPYRMLAPCVYIANLRPLLQVNRAF
jgi:hypothetical protein